MADRNLDTAVRIRLQDRTGPGVRSVRGNIRSISDQLRRMQAIFVGFQVLRPVFGALSRGFRAILSATVGQEQAQAQVAARLRATGGAAGYGAAELARMASALQDVTTYGDEAILEMQALLLSFREIKGDRFRDATEAVLDLSVATGQDLRSAAVELGKALNDPARGLDGLSRSGTTFSGAQKKLVKGLAETGQTARAQGVILREIRRQYGDAARAARDTFGGALEGLRNAFGDLLEGRDSLPGAREEIEKLTSALKDPSLAGAGDRVIAGMAGSARLLAENFTLAASAAGALGAVILGKAASAAVSFAAAQVHARAAARAHAVAATGLRAAYALLGGPTGMIFLAATALAVYATRASEAEKASRRLRDVKEKVREIDLLLASASGERAEKLREERGELLAKAEAEIKAAEATVEVAMATARAPGRESNRMRRQHGLPEIEHDPEDDPRVQQAQAALAELRKLREEI